MGDRMRGGRAFVLGAAGQGRPAGAGKLFLRRNDGKARSFAQPDRAEDRAGALDAFATAFRSGQEPQFFPSGRDNVCSLATSFACIQSSEEDGRWLSLSDLLAEREAN